MYLGEFCHPSYSIFSCCQHECSWTTLLQGCHGNTQTSVLWHLHTSLWCDKVCECMLSLSLILVLFLCRPLEITTAVFGKKWGTLTCEKKVKIPSSLKTPAEFMERVKSKLNFHPVEVIGESSLRQSPISPITPESTYPEVTLNFNFLFPVLQWTRGWWLVSPTRCHVGGGKGRLETLVHSPLSSSKYWADQW